MSGGTTFKSAVDWLTRRNKRDTISFRTLRFLIGVLGMALPFALLLGGWAFARYPVQSSISIYYYLNAGDVLVGTLFLVGVFLMTYKGYDALDNLATIVTGALGIGIALFPCDNKDIYGPLARAGESVATTLVPERVGLLQLLPEVSDKFHMGFAISFFALLALNSMFLFTRFHGEYPSRKRIRRKLLYVGCGMAILFFMASIGISFMVLPAEFAMRSGIIFWCETGCLLAFGISWLVKSQVGSRLYDRARSYLRLKSFLRRRAA